MIDDQVTNPGPAKARLTADRDQTLDRLAGLERQFAAIVASTSEGSAGGDDEHDPEGATVAFERQHVAALAAQARGHLAEIDAALRKIDSGTYEICDMCGGPIGGERLAARPAALICVRCAAKRR
jgi:DnaK suppressor protein